MSRPNLYDYLKILAILTMIVDHIGYFFFPEYEILRLIGRIAFPIFLFLVGFSGSYKRRRDLVICALLVQIPLRIMYFGYDYGSPTLNILRSIILARIVIGGYAATKQKRRIAIILSIFLLGGQLTLAQYIDYGSFAIIFALMGYLMKTQKEKIPVMLYSIAIMLLFRWYTVRKFNRWWTNGIRLAGGFIILLYIYFRLWQGNKKITLQRKIDPIILRTSKRALYIYIIHLFIFVIIKGILILTSTA